jgi:hypothetical protein
MNREKMVNRIEQNGMPNLISILSPLLKSITIEYYRMLSSFFANSNEAQKAELLIHNNIVNPNYKDEIAVETKKLHALILAKYGGKTPQPSEANSKPVSNSKDGLPYLNLIIPIEDFNRYIKREVKTDKK